MQQPSPQYHRHRHLTRAEIRRRRTRRAVRRVGVITALLMVLALGVGVVSGRMGLPAASADSSPAGSLASSSAVTTPGASSAANGGASAPAASEPAASSTPSAESILLGGMTPEEAAEMLADPLMVLVNHHTQMPEDYTFDTKECGSATAINKTLQTEAADAFLAMQAAAAADGVTVWMQSGYRSVSYQTTLYNNKTQQYLDQGYDEATARELAAGIVNPPGYSEHNCGLAADLNCPEFTALEEGFENTAAFAWLTEHAEEYGFILRYPKGEEAEAVTEITYEPWHWRYVGPENAARINASGLYFEQYIETLQKLAAQGA